MANELRWKQYARWRGRSFFSLLINEDLTIHILQGLGREYDSLVVPLTTRSYPLPLDDLFGLLLTHEHRLEHHDLASFAPLPSSPRLGYSQSDVYPM